MRPWVAAAAAAGLLSMLMSATVGATSVQAEEIVVLSTGAAKEALIEIIPLFERASGHKINITFGPGPATMEKVRAGATGDLFIGPAEFSEPLVKEGKLVAGSTVEFAMSGSGIAVKAGAARPDVSTSDKFKAALLTAKTVSYSSGASGLLFVRILERLGIADAIRAKRVAPQPGEPVGAVLARGEAEIGVQQMSELLPVAGIDILGPLPPGLENKIPYGASVFPSSMHRDAGKAFVSFLRSETAGSIIKKKGMDPI